MKNDYIAGSTVAVVHKALTIPSFWFDCTIQEVPVLVKSGKKKSISSETAERF